MSAFTDAAVPGTQVSWSDGNGQYWHATIVVVKASQPDVVHALVYNTHYNSENYVVPIVHKVGTFTTQDIIDIVTKFFEDQLVEWHRLNKTGPNIVEGRYDGK